MKKILNTGSAFTAPEYWAVALMVMRSGLTIRDRAALRATAYRMLVRGIGTESAFKEVSTNEK